MRQTSLPPDEINYIISSYELRDLEEGVPIPLYFNSSIFFLSVSGSLLGSILVPISEIGFAKSNLTSIILFIFACVLFIVGAILLITWINKRQKIKNVVQEIKDRMPKNTLENTANIPTNFGNTQENIN